MIVVIVSEMWKPSFYPSGTESCFEYIPVIKIFNTTLRIKGLINKLGTKLLVLENTLMERGRFSERLGSFLLSGKSNPITIYQILADGALASSEGPVYTELFSTALELFRARQWQQAKTTLARCLELEPDDDPSPFYLKLCRIYQCKLPAANWQGVIPVGK